MFFSKARQVRRSAAGFALLAFLWLLPLSPAQAFKLYGRWCGPNHGFKGAPIDAVDAACKDHDICCKTYIDRPFTEKIQHCKCDALILQKLRAAYPTKLSTEARAAATTMLTYFSSAPCFCYKQICLPETTCKINESCTKIAGKRVCVKKPVCKVEKVCKKRPVSGIGGKCP